MLLSKRKASEREKQAREKSKREKQARKASERERERRTKRTRPHTHLIFVRKEGVDERDGDAAYFCGDRIDLQQAQT